MPTALVVGGSRGLGLELTKGLLSRQYKVFATVRSQNASLPSGVNVITDVDIAEESAGAKIVEGLSGQKLDLVFVNAGVFKSDVSGNLCLSRIKSDS